jgi:hypothetical protein
VMTVNGYPSQPILLRAGKFTLNRFIQADGDITRVEFAFSHTENYGSIDQRRLASFLHEISLHPTEDLTPVVQTLDRPIGDNYQLTGIDTDGWAAKAVSFHLPPLNQPKVLDLQLELPSWAAASKGKLEIMVDGRSIYADSTAAGTYQTIKVPLASPQEQTIAIVAQNEFPLPNQTNKLRSYRIVKMALRDLAPDEKFDGTAVRSVPPVELFDVDQDGWTGRRARLAVSAAKKAEAVEFQIEFPGWASAVTGKFLFTLNGRVVYSEELPRGLYKTIRVPLDPGRDNDLVMEASQEFSLPPPDQRVRSYRIVKYEVK